MVLRLVDAKVALMAADWAVLWDTVTVGLKAD